MTNITFPEPENTQLCHPFSGHSRWHQPRTGVGDFQSPVVYVAGVSTPGSLFCSQYKGVGAHSVPFSVLVTDAKNKPPTHQLAERKDADQQPQTVPENEIEWAPR